MNLDKTGKFLVMLRKERKLTQVQVAEAIDVSDKTVSKWERGICLPENATIDKLLKFYNITMMELFAGEKNHTLANNDVNETTKKAIKFHEKIWFKKNKKIFLTAIAIFLLILCTIFGYFTITNYNKNNVYKIFSIDTNNYNADGNIIIAHGKCVVSISNIQFFEQKNKIYTKAIEYKIYINEQLITKGGDIYNFTPQDQYQNLNDFLKNISIYTDKISLDGIPQKNPSNWQITIFVRCLDEHEEEQDIYMNFALSNILESSKKISEK